MKPREKFDIWNLPLKISQNRLKIWPRGVRKRAGIIFKYEL